MASSPDPARLAQGLGLSLLNNASPTPSAAHANSPVSAVSMPSSSHTQSAIQPYNPQEWVPSPAQVVDRSRQFATEAAQDAASAPPPPPYSPPRNRRQRPMSTAFEHAVACGLGSTPPPPSRMPMPLLHRPSPEPPGNPSFPPPPGTGRRGNSRERRFGLPSLGRRKENEQPHPTSPPDVRAVPWHMRRSMGSTVPHQEPERFLTPAATTAHLVVPPAARRAVSTGAIGTPASQRSRSASQTRWEPGMPLPPPPPGPPPSSFRSQSVQSIDRSSVPIASPPTRRPPPSGVASLGPVPPTPADWVDTDAEPARGRSPGLVIDTTTAANATGVSDPSGSSNSAGGLNRARAVRHDKTILERRAESRNRQSSSHGSVDAITQPHHGIQDIIVPSSSGKPVGRLSVNKSTPRSASRREVELLRTCDSWTNDSRNSTPRAPGSARPEAATPTFSPYQSKILQTPASAPALALISLPTPPPRTRSASGSRPRDSSRPPVSLSTAVSTSRVIRETAEQFASAAIERFRAFAARESMATSDADRVRMFADFVVSESQIRRERYSFAIGAMGSEIFDLTRDLFRPMTASSLGRESEMPPRDELAPASMDASPSQRDYSGSTTRGQGLSVSAPASANLPASPGSAPAAGNANWANNYMPSLSPILSMSVSDNYENGSSRGRPPSRWWETDSQGEARVSERSKRESKYMGVPKEQWFEEEQGIGGAHTGASDGGPSSEYPPEKTGWHDQRDCSSGTPQRPGPFGCTSGGGASGPSSSRHNKPDALDVSRLVTMPPPYPRHHPAVNNNHPELTTTRTSVRSLNDLSEVDKVKERFAMGSSKRREEFFKEASERRQALAVNLQTEISSGNIGYADAAVIESDSQDEEKDKRKELEKKEYDEFQKEVVLPLNDLLTSRITRATELFDGLASHLFDSGQMDADMPQEEGDDRPELLEKLTLLKWIFETRESLHRAIYDILSDRNSRYREVVMSPYRLSGNQEKLQAAEIFFAEDAATRESAFANEVLNRAREFRSAVEGAVQRGVALQLSAFWDIAPPLRRLLDSIPSNLLGFSIQIPASEFEENPAYHQHPLQYLYSLVMHAEKSTYQFIEAHTNLLCLLHEVKEAVVHAKASVLETQCREPDGSAIRAEERDQRARAMREGEGRRLTEDLKEKVRVVQDQWNSALGEGIKNVKHRTGEWLLRTGGWDETLEEDAAFSGP